jgi:N-acetylmuramoyl-L-alanine amidase
VKLLSTAVTPLCVLALAAPAAEAAAPRPVDFELAPGAKALASAAGGDGLVSQPLRTPRRFNLVGLRWRGKAEPEIELRVRKGGRWSHWEHLQAHSDHNPDLWRGEGIVSGSDPLWVGRAGAVQYRLSRRVPRLRLHFVDLGAPRRSTLSARAAARPLRARGAQVPAPFPYVSRDAWGAAACQPRETPDYGTVQAVNVHHTVSLNDYSREEAPSVVLAICRYHRNSNGWDDIGYNMLVDKYGTLYEGRAGGLDQAVIGAQAQGFNSQTAGIANIGDHSAVPQTPEALTAMANYIRWKLTVHAQPLSGPVTLTSAGGSATRYPSGASATVERVIGHRDTGKTACPGEALYAQLPDLRALVQSGAVPVVSSATSVSAALADDRLDYGQTAPVGGTLTAPDGSPLAGEPVEIQVASDGSWRTARRATTGADGAFSTELKPRLRMYVRVRYAGRSGLRSSTSPRLLLRVQPLVTLDRPARRGAVGTEVPLTGSVAPRKRTMVLVVQRRVGGRYRKAGARTVRARRGRFATSFVPARSGVYRYYVVAKADLDTDRGASERVTLRAR